MFDPTDPSNLTTEQRHDELTTLLATGVRRLLAQRPPRSSDSSQNRLDVVPESLPHATRPVNANREQRRS
jgi:hypothetical protein